MRQALSAVHPGAAEHPEIDAKATSDEAHDKNKTLHGVDPAPAPGTDQSSTIQRPEETIRHTSLHSSQLSLELQQHEPLDPSLQSHSPPRDTPHDNHATHCVTPPAVTKPHDSNKSDDTAVTASDHPVAPPLPVLVPPISHSNTALRPSQSPSFTILKARPSLPQQNNSPAIRHAFSLHESQIDGAYSSTVADEDKMIFGNRANPSQRRRAFANTSAITEYEADLTSKDRAKQKAAVARFLAERVKQDWEWEWPRKEASEASEPPQGTPEIPIEETAIIEDGWKSRDEWESNASEGEDLTKESAQSTALDSLESKESPFRFESPDLVGASLAKRTRDRKRHRQERLRDEMAWNDGVDCFVRRRDAWTCARKVSLVTRMRKVKSSTSASDGEGSSTPIDEVSEYDEEWDSDTEVPIAEPLLPPENAMRASITPAAYNTIYDKVIVQQLTPSCPMNLKDVTRSCVQGWKRDGEWPPKSSVPEPKKKQRTRSMSIASILGLERHQTAEKPQGAENAAEKKDNEKPQPIGGIRRSLQKILSLGQHGGHNEHENTKK